MTRSPAFARFLLALPGALAAAAAVALAGAAAAGRHRLFAYPDLLLFDLLGWLAWTVPGAVLFLLLADVLAPFAARRRLPAARWAAALVAALPALAAAGWHANRAWGIRPAALLGLAPYAVWRNLALVAAGLLAAGVAAWALGRRPASPEPAAARRALRRSAALALAIASLWAGVTAWFSTAADKPRPDAIVLLIDAARADRFGVYGHDRATTPAIDAFARDAVVFRQAVASSTFTKSSVASIFTGRYVYQHGVFEGSARETADRVTSDLLSREETTLAEALRDRGVVTQSWVQNSHLLPFMGFAQGFVDYRADQGEASRIGDLFGRWAAGPGRRHPFFAYVHFIDLHDPYRPPAPYDRMFGAGPDPYAGLDLENWGSHLEAVRRGEVVVEPERLARMTDLYDGQLRQVDDEIGRLLARLKALGLYDDALIVVTSDHGDAFGEHGFIAHSAAPYEELVRVPLIVKLPGNRHGGRSIDRQVRLVDLFPTVLDALGVGEREGEKSWVGRKNPPELEAGGPVEVPGLAPAVELPRGGEVAGCSLVALLRAGDAETSPRAPACDLAVVEIADEEGAEPTVGLRTARWKYLLRPSTGAAELYDLAADPGERANLAGADPASAEAAAAEAAFHRLALEVVARRAETGARKLELDQRLIEEMKSLGYLRG